MDDLTTSEEVTVIAATAIKPINVFTGRTIGTIILKNFSCILGLSIDIHTHPRVSM
jgi:hypothetical protein